MPVLLQTSHVLDRGPEASRGDFRVYTHKGPRSRRYILSEQLTGQLFVEEEVGRIL
jgi:hypothetical protein